jgi:hypothetical protein
MSEQRFPVVRVWLVVTSLWAVATILRVSREWLPVEDWKAVVTGPWFWISLGLPPSMFAIILLAIRRITLRDTRPLSNLFRRRPKGCS